MGKSIRLELILSFLLILLISIGVYSNQLEKRSIDLSKLPKKVEESKGFQRWITNLKNKGLDISADEFLLLEENEIYNSKWMSVKSFDEKNNEEEYYKTMDGIVQSKKLVLSPSKRLFIDIRDEPRDSYTANQARFYGLLDDKIIDSRILECSHQANCYLDRAWFIENDVFIISEFSESYDDYKTNNPPVCSISENCEYTVKIHLVDLKNNQRLTYKSITYSLDLGSFKKEL